MLIPRLVARRLVALVPVLLLVSFGVFALVLAIPGDPAQTLAGGENATPADIARVRHQLGLDKPFLTQYWHWLSHAARFDFGRSLITQHKVSTDLGARMPITLSIALVGLAVALVLGVAAGVAAGARPGAWSDKANIVLATIGVAVPSMVVAIFLVKFFAIDWKFFPAVGYTHFSTSAGKWLRSVALPGFALGLAGAGALARQLRSGLVDNLGSDYVRTSWSVGSPARVAVGKHALRNASIPAVTVVGLLVSALLGGTVIIEQIFSIQGIGTYLYSGVLNKDLPVIQGVVIWFVLVQLAVFLVVDVVLALLNPRVRVQ